MIKRLHSDKISLSRSYYGYKIRSVLKAYGTEYGFCRLYENERGGHILVFNGTLTADGEFDTEEILQFIGMISPFTVEISREIPIPSGYSAQERCLFKAPCGIICGEMGEIRKNDCIKECLPIIAEGFGADGLDEWYVDISHRVRHGVSDIYLYKTTTVTKAFDIDGFAFLSHIATAKHDRGQGNAGKLLKQLSSKLQSMGKDIYLYSKKERVSFYDSLGFERVCSDKIYEKI